MKLYRFTTCEDDTENVLGVKFSLWSDETQTELELSPIGTIDGTCRTLTIEEGTIEAMQASFSQ